MACRALCSLCQHCRLVQRPHCGKALCAATASCTGVAGPASAATCGLDLYRRLSPPVLLLLLALDGAASFCSSTMEELGGCGGGAEGAGSIPAALLRRILDVSELSTAVACLESGVVKLCLTAEPRGASVHGVVTRSTRCLVTCFGVAARALKRVYMAGAFQQGNPELRLSMLGGAIMGIGSRASAGDSPLQAAMLAQVDAQAGTMLAGLRRCTKLLASPELLAVDEHMRQHIPGKPHMCTCCSADWSNDSWVDRLAPHAALRGMPRLKFPVLPCCRRDVTAPALVDLCTAAREPVGGASK